MTETEKYVRRYLGNVLAFVEASPIAQVRNGLTIFEKTLIYFYTGDGYRSINSNLRQRNDSRAATLLELSIRKLPNWQGLVYRTARLTKREIDRYRKSLSNGVPVIEPTFVSTSRSQTKVQVYPKWNVQFQIFSIHGKLVEECSCLGTIFPPNEEEVLILPGQSFLVLDVNDSAPTVLIILKELAA